MPTIGQSLTQKAGPLPVWAWAGLGTAGLAAYLMYRSKKQAAATAAANQQTGSTMDSSNLGTVPVSDLTQVAQPMPIQMGDTFVDTSQSQSQTAGAAASTGGPATVTGTSTSSSGTPGSTSTSSSSSSSASTPTPIKTPAPPAKTLAPAPKPAPPPPPPKTQTVCPWPQWCGSLWGIAQHYYGNGAEWTKIYNANRAKIGSNPNLIHPGLVLTIPT